MAKKEKEVRTNAMRILERNHIAFSSMTYECDEFTDGIQTARLLGIPYCLMYKTLVTIGKSGAYYVFVIPVNMEIDFKKAAKAAGEKSLEMLPLKNLTAVTGYVRGGCTSIGMKKAFPTFIDESAQLLEEMIISGGKRGLQLKLAPEDLRKAAAASFADITVPHTDTVIFDLGKVLVNYDWQSFLDSFGFDRKTYKAVAEAVFLNEDWERGDAGASPDEWLCLFLENAPEYEKEIRQVYENLEGCITGLPYTEELISHFRNRGFRIFYLSNYSEYLYEKTKEKLLFIKEFDGGVFSYSEKCIKPDKAIYKQLLKRYDIVAENALFFDDRAENVRAARELGIQGILFTPETVRKVLG